MQRYSFIFLLFLAAGCRSAQLAHDQDAIRTAVLDLQTNQIMDNLVRFDQGLPIIHVDYTSVSGQIQHAGGAKGSLQNNVQHGHSGALLALLTRNLSWVWVGELSASQQNQLSISGQPVLANPQVYNAYLEFYSKPGRLMRTDAPPPPGAALLVRCAVPTCDDQLCDSHGFLGLWKKGHKKKAYYWIPCEHKEDFKRLSLFAVAVRGDTQSVPTYYEVAIRGFDGNPEYTKEEKTVRVVLIFDKKIPHAKGFLTARIKGRLYEERELDLQPDPKSEKPIADPDVRGEVSKHDRLMLTFTIAENDKEREDPRRVNASMDEALKDLASQVVRVRLTSFAPGVSTTTDLLEAIRRELEQIKLNQQFQK